MSIVFATGPKVTTMTREAAVEAAKTNPQFPKNADDITVEELDGHWVAAIHVADNPFGGPADQTDDGPGPKSEGPGDTQDVKPDDHDSDDGGPPGDHPEPDGDEGPPKDDEHKEKGGESHKIDALFDAVQKILVALGIPDTEGGEENPVPGEEPPAGPPGPEGGPPGAPPAPEEVHHEKSLKPGEVPPGQTPVGAPAFSHTNPIIARGEAHPWEGLIGVTATFEVEERVPDHYSAADVDAELREVAYGTGFKVKQARVFTDERTGHRMAKALISAY